MSPWVRLDDRFSDDPRVIGAGLDAAGLLVALVCWSNGTLADGFVPAPVVRQKAVDAADVVQRLVSVGLLIPDDRDGVSGFRLHDDILKHQPTRKDVEEQRHQRAVAGRTGGQRSGATRRQRADEANRKRAASSALEANAKHAASVSLEPRPDPSRSDPRSRSQKDRSTGGRKVGKEGSGKPSEGNLDLGDVRDPQVQALVDTWNTTSGRLPKIRKITPKRRAAYRKALAEHPDLNDWARAARFLTTQDWTMGGSPGHPKWYATLDYLTRPDVLIRHLEKADALANGLTPMARGTAAGRVWAEPGKYAHLSDPGGAP